MYSAQAANLDHVNFFHVTKPFEHLQHCYDILTMVDGDKDYVG